MNQLYYRLWRYLAICLIILLFSAVPAYCLSSRLQRIVSGPVLELIRTMQNVSSSRNFSVRVEKQSYDEIGTLFEGFNDMLARIQSRDEQLERHREFLEDEVSRRTVELAEANMDLKTMVIELKIVNHIKLLARV